MVTGKPIIGKGLFLQQMGFCVATGTPFLNKMIGEPQKVYHIDFELMEASLRDRLWKMCEHFSVGKEAERDRLWKLVNENMAVLATIDHPELNGDPEFFKEITQRTASKHKAVLTLFDPLWQICPSEMDEEKLRGFLRMLARFTRESGSSVVYAQHQTKGDQRGKDVIDRFSGRNDLARDCATLVALSELKAGQARVEVRTNDFYQPEPFLIELDYPVFEFKEEAKTAKDGTGLYAIPAADLERVMRRTGKEWILQADLVAELVHEGFKRATIYRTLHREDGYLRRDLAYRGERKKTEIKWNGAWTSPSPGDGDFVP